MNFGFVIKIVAVFSKQPFLQITIRELSKQAKLSYNATHRTVQQLLKEKILLQQKYGTVCVLTMNPTSEAIALLAFTAYKDAEKWKIEKKYRNSHLPKNIFSIINIKNELMAIGESRQTDSIVLDGGEIKLMTIHELIAALSNHTLTLDKIKIFQGAEYLFEKIVESK